MASVSHARPRVWAARRTLPWLISLASLAMVVSAWCWQFALGAGTHQHAMPAVAVAAAGFDDAAVHDVTPAAVAAQAGSRAEVAEDSTGDSAPDSTDACVELVAPVAGQSTTVGTPAGRQEAGRGSADLGTTGPRAPPQPAA